MEWHIASARATGITEIAIVCGFKAEKMPFEDVHYFFNPRYASTNMVETLKCARSFWHGGFIASYSDIVFEPEMLRQQMNSPHPISVTIDRKWKPFWEQRFENVLEDAETLKMDGEGKILQLGAKPEDITEIQGQYVGLTGFANSAVPELEKFLDHSDCRLTPGSYMTDLLQELISKKISFILPDLTQVGLKSIPCPILIWQREKHAGEERAPLHQTLNSLWLYG